MSATESLWVVGNEYFGDSFSKRGLNGKTVDAKLVREPTNKFDRNAVGVHIGRDQVGYISAYQAQKAAPWLDSVGGKMATTGRRPSEPSADEKIPKQTCGPRHRGSCVQGRRRR